MFYLVEYQNNAQTKTTCTKTCVLKKKKLYCVWSNLHFKQPDDNVVLLNTMQTVGNINNHIQIVNFSKVILTGHYSLVLSGESLHQLKGQYREITLAPTTTGRANTNSIKIFTTKITSIYSLNSIQFQINLLKRKIPVIRRVYFSLYFWHPGLHDVIQLLAGICFHTDQIIKIE